LKFDTSGKPLRSAPNTELLAGMIIQGTPYVAIYNNSDGAFYLQGLFGNPYNIPLAAGLDYWGSTTPNSCFAFPTGQAISRTTYAALFAIMGTTYGTGDGSTTFNLPDKTGRVSAMREAVATRLTNVGFGGNSANMGATGGGDNLTLTLNHVPNGITSTGTVTVSVPGNQVPFTNTAVNFNANISGGGPINIPTAAAAGGWGGVSSLSGTPTLASNNTGTQASGGAKNVPTVQPTIICNYIIRIV
jgi:microcystin-dependent protein